MKKSICTLLIGVILCNFIFCQKVYADDEAPFEGVDSIDSNSITASDVESLTNEGTVSNSPTGGILSITFNLLGSVIGAIAGILVAVVNLFPMLIQLAMTVVCVETFTIENAVFNLIPILNIDYFDVDSTYTVGSKHKITRKLLDDDAITVIKNSISKYFIIIRLIASAVSLLVLIYVGIRMALSTIAADKAKYQKMFMAWLESVIILFTLQYIIAFLLQIGKTFGNILYDLKVDMEANGSEGFETKILNTVYSTMFITAGWQYVLYSIIYWFLIFIQTKFFLMYLKRVVTVGFLILIAPAVTITYPIDKVGDGKAQAFTVWFSELVVNILIQPIHALIYLVFVFTAGEIAEASILVAAVFLFSMTKVEKYVLRLFNLRNVVSLKPVDEQRKKGV